MVPKLSVAMIVALLLVSASTAVVGAAPINNPHAEPVVLDCDGVEYVVIVASGNTGHVLDSTQRLIPHHFTFEFVADGEVLFSEEGGVGQGQKRGLQDRLVTCTGELPVSGDEIGFIEEEFGLDLSGMSVVYQVTVEAMMTPAGPKQ